MSFQLGEDSFIIYKDGNQGAGKVLTSDDFGIARWQSSSGDGTVTSFSFTSANGFTGIVTNPTTTPNLTLSIADLAVTTKLLTGYAVGANSPILATDTILSAFGKTQGQINAITSATAIALDRIPKGTGTGIANGTWAFNGNDIYPITDGSNIGLNGTNRVGTIFISSTIAYGSDLIFSRFGFTMVTFKNLNLAFETGVTIADSSSISVLDVTNRTLTDSSGLTVYDFGNNIIYDSSSVISINPETRELNDSTGTMSINWQNALLAIGGITSINWGNRLLFSSSSNTSVDWENRLLADFGGTTTVDWQNKQLIGAGFTAVDWQNNILQDFTGVSVNWGNRLLVSSGGISILSWTDTSVGIGTTTPAVSTILDLTSTTGALLISRMTTAQRDLLTAANGMQIYNTTTNLFNLRENGAWVVLGAGTVTSVTGTLNRITASPTTGDVIVDISASYVGQASITTLGTITTGVWNGSVIAGQFGGTGVANTGLTITLAGNLVTSGANSLTFTTTAATNVTLPVSGTLYGTLAASITSAQLLSSMSDETGTGMLVFGTSPTFTTQITSPIINGSAAASGTLTLVSTTNATKGKILFGTSGYDEVNNRLGIGNTTPTNALSVTGASDISTTLSVGTFAKIGSTAGFGNAVLLVKETMVGGGIGSSVDVIGQPDDISETITGFSVIARGADGTNAITQTTGLTSVARHQTTQNGNILVGSTFQWQSANLATGTVSTAKSIVISAPTVTGTGAKPTTATGIEVANQGLAGITTSYGLRVLAQSGSTTNWALAVETGNAYNASKFFMGGTTVPTALLHLAAGTTAASTAPLKFTTGTSMTTAEAGAVEFTTDDLFFTITTGAARKRLTMADAIAGLISGRVPFATTNGRLTDSANMTYTTNRLSPTYVTLAAGAAGAGNAPLKLTSGTNLTAVEAGAIEFDGTVLFSSLNVTSGRGITPTTYLTVAFSDFVGTDVNTAQPVFTAAQDTFTVQSFVGYYFEGCYKMSRAAGGTSHTIGVLFGGTATFTNIDYMATTTSTTGNVLGTPSSIWIKVATNTAVTAASTVTTENNIIYVRGFMRISLGGTIIPQIQFSAAPGGAPTFERNSYFKLYSIGSDLTTTVGAWT